MTDFTGDIKKTVEKSRSSTDVTKSKSKAKNIDTDRKGIDTELSVTQKKKPKAQTGIFANKAPRSLFWYGLDTCDVSTL